MLSPDTRRVDLVMKRSEYADAGIPHYWIVDLHGLRLEVLTLVEGVDESVQVTVPYTTSEPFEVNVDLSRLV